MFSMPIACRPPSRYNRHSAAACAAISLTLARLAGVPGSAPTWIMAMTDLGAMGMIGEIR